ncbi:MAG TPA: uracil-DNA glycosylase [Bacteroidota bacterium]|nr:uracil-DNA glycosylase [Bacteroidota bacterium]
MNDDVQSTLLAVQNFLRQQRELSGNTIYRSTSRPAALTQEAGARESTILQAISPQSAVHEQESEQYSGEGLVATKKKSLQAPSPAPTQPPAASRKGVRGCNELWETASTLAALNEYIRQCADCPLASTRTNFVFGVGPSNARVMVIGEAPGADEDAQGEPFVGKAGQLLNKILESIQFKREDVFIANILKCRPPGNRRPLPSEVEHCEPYLWKQIELVKPKLILCLGLTAAQTLLKTTSSLGVLRESLQEYRGIPLVVTYHPAALLRNPNWKRPTWEDVKKFRKLYDELPSGQ